MPFKSTVCLVASVAIFVSVSAPVRSADSSPDFSSEVRPILSDHCFACHGPDENDRQADLRLDTAEGIGLVVEPHAADESELIRRLRSDDPHELMPPPEYKKPLTPDEVATLEAWVNGGGEVQGHWSFLPPVKAELPAETTHPIDHFIDAKIESLGLTPEPVAKDTALLRRVCLDLTGLPPSRDQIERVRSDGLDYERLVDELLASPAFGQHFGRHWLDLVRYADTHGLHLDNYREMWPYRDWVIDAINRNMPFDQFVAEQLAGDLFPDATLEQQIASGFNRLNVTTSEGGSIYDEVFARNVIDRTDAFGTVFLGLTTQCAVCHDHKFDPISQREYYSLSAFFNSLDGRALDGNKKDHPPVVRVPDGEQVRELEDFDRQIAQLRDEMSGPIESVDAAQRIWEASLAAAADRGDAAAGDERLHRLVPDEVHGEQGTEWQVDGEGVVTVKANAADREIQTLIASLDRSLVDGGWQSLRIDVIPNPETDRVGVSSNGNAVLTEITLETRASADASWEPLEITSATADVEQEGGEFAVQYAFDGKREKAAGWAVGGHQQTGGRKASFACPDLARRIDAGQIQIRIRLEFMSTFSKHQFYGVRFQLSDAAPKPFNVEPIQVSEPQLVGPFPVESENPGFYRTFASEQSKFQSDQSFKYRDKTYTWKPQPDWTPVTVHELPIEDESVAVNLVHLSLKSPKKQSVDLLLGTSDGHVVYLNNNRVAESKHVGPIDPLSQTYSLELKKGQNDLYIKTVSLSRPGLMAYAFRSPAIELPESIVELARQAPKERSEEQSASLTAYYRQVQCTHPDWTAMQDMVKGLQDAKANLRNEIPTTLVWKELDEPRQAKVLIRGQYDNPGDPVDRAVPSFLPPMQDDLPRDRLGLARWLMTPEHPLTARVAVNRFWQAVFGSGLVRSSEDFGSQGSPPSHPELLDWLAVDFAENGWNVKGLIKQMVTSEAYRRDAHVSEPNLAIDPANQYYARGPRHRLDAEVLRDQALSLAGLLNPASSGPSVKPPQPDGLWYAVGYTRSNTANFKADPELEKQLRRSVYIFWKRTSSPPQMSTFDAPSRESCTARRERTNTPLQALLLMNEHQYLQAAKHLAIRSLGEPESDDPVDRIAWMFETVTARQPAEREVRELATLLESLRGHYAQHSDQAAELLSVDEVSPEKVDTSDLAAWMVIASTLLNLDEVVNK